MRGMETVRERTGRTIETGGEILGMRGRMKMITFIKRDGTRFSASYSYLHGVYLLAAGLRLEFTRYGVVVQGDRLSEIQHRLADHRIAFLRESPNELPDDESAPHIRKIILTGPTRSI